MVGKGIVTKPVLIAPAPTSKPHIVGTGTTLPPSQATTIRPSATVIEGERNGSDEMVDMQMDEGGMGSIESGESGSGSREEGNGDVDPDAKGEEDGEVMR